MSQRVPYAIAAPRLRYAPAPPPRRAGEFIRAALSRCARVGARWIERAHQRKALAELDDRLLRDIGVTRVAARREAGKPFWR